MDPQLIRQWKAGHEAVNRIVEAERLEMTPAERLRDLTAIWRRAHLMRLPPKPFDPSLAERWQRLREASQTPRG